MKPPIPPSQSSSSAINPVAFQVTAEFATETCQKVVSILCQQAGFKAIKRPALEALSDIITLYLDKLFSTTEEYAELANRIKPTFFDLEKALNDMGVTGNSLEQYLNTLRAGELLENVVTYMKPSLSEQTTVEPQHDFLPSDDEATDEDAAFQDENRPTDGSQPTGSTKRPNTQPQPDYIPTHLPVFPSRHTYMQTPVFVTRTDDPQRLRELNMQQSRLVEENLKKLMTAENELLSRGATTSSSAPVNPTLGSMLPIVNYESHAQRKKQLHSKLSLKNTTGSGATTTVASGIIRLGGLSHDNGIWSHGTNEEEIHEDTVVVRSTEKKKRKGEKMVS